VPCYETPCILAGLLMTVTMQKNTHIRARGSLYVYYFWWASSLRL